jgi:ring-1,2-phenylacetyl-CoA epoxidase subunit PaaD
MVASEARIQQVWSWLDEIRDPEVPVLSIVDLGIVRSVEVAGHKLRITITPTYCGCPAMDVIRQEIRSHLSGNGIDDLELVTRLSPPWTTDWLTQNAKDRLHKEGIAPPPSQLVSAIDIGRARATVACPQCGSANTTLVSRFGSTACKAHYKCNECLEPFDAFKQH